MIHKADSGTELRQLGLAEDEERVYEALLRDQAADADELARLSDVPRPRLDAALDSLAKQGLTALGAPLPRPMPPAAAIRTLVHLRQAELHRRSAELEQLMASAQRIADRLVEGSSRAYEGGIEVVAGALAIIGRVDSMLAAAEHEVMILDRLPYAKGPEEYDDSSRSAGLDVESLLERGVVVRTVVDRDALGYPGRTRSLHRLAEQGARIRTSPGVPTKMIMVDRRITLLPPTEATDPAATALVVGDALLHNALAPLFETVWERSTPLGSPDVELSETQRELLALLAAGLKDEAIARRVGVHVHTVRRRIAGLLESLAAETRFQAGARATRQGWLDFGNDDHPATTG